MTPEHARMMARYNRWMNDSLYAASARLTDAERRRDRGAFFKSIHGTLNHILLADRVWMARLTGVDVGDALGPGGIQTLDQELYADFDELRRARTEMDGAFERYAAELTPDRLAGPHRFVRKGTPHEYPLWQLLAHVYNHQTHHRGQVTTLVLQAGGDPGVTDLFAMMLQGG